MIRCQHPLWRAPLGSRIHKYDVIISWSNEDGTSVAEVPGIPGCSAHGDTRVALENVKQAIDLRIDTAREFGDPVPDPRGERMILE